MIPTRIRRTNQQEENSRQKLFDFIIDRKLYPVEVLVEDILDNLHKSEDLFLSASQYLAYAFVLHQKEIIQEYSNGNADSFWFRVHKNHFHIGILYLCGLFDEKAQDHGSLPKLIKSVNALDAQFDFSQLTDIHKDALKRLKKLRNKWLAHYSFNKEYGQSKWRDPMELLYFSASYLDDFYKKFLGTDHLMFESKFFLEEVEYAFEEISSVFELPSNKQKELLELIKSRLKEFKK